MPIWEMLLRISTGVGLGALIGLEREYRARMAGLRTHALVAVGATLFVLLSANGISGLPSTCPADPTRVAAQIVSGIGFLGAGVILRDGLKVRGLDTAATLWCSAAVGTLAGAGLYLIAVAGTAAVLATNIFLRCAVRAVDAHSRSDEAAGASSSALSAGEEPGQSAGETPPFSDNPGPSRDNRGFGARSLGRRNDERDPT